MKKTSVFSLFLVTALAFWGVPLRAQDVRGTAPANLEWYASVLGVTLGAAGFEVADLEGDGSLEIVVTGNTRPGALFDREDAWNVLGYVGAGSYDLEFSQLPYEANIDRLRVAQADADAELEILVALPGELRIYGGAGYALERILPLHGGVMAMEVADFGADGGRELAICGFDGFYLYDLADGNLLQHESSWTCGAMAVGQGDADVALEIALTGSGNDRVIDGASPLAAQWTVGFPGFGGFVRWADVRGDGRQELVAAGQAIGGVDVYDAEKASLIYGVAVAGVSALEVGDVEGDGSIEVLYAESPGNAIHVLAGATGVEKWQVDNPHVGVTRLAVGDVDGDGPREVLWGSGHEATGPDTVCIADPVSHLVEWRSRDLKGPVVAGHGDIDGDGKPELLLATAKSGTDSQYGYYLLRDAASKSLERLGAAAPLFDLERAVTANLDLDPQLEVCVGGDEGSSGAIVCYDGASGAEQWRLTLPPGRALRSLAAADVDGDADVDIVVGTGRASSSEKLYVYALAGATGLQVWRSPALDVPLGNHLDLLRVADVDTDPAPEVVVASAGNRLLILDGVSGAVQISGSSDATALATPRLGAKAEILIGTISADVLRIDPNDLSGETLVDGPVLLGSVTGLDAADIDGDGTADLVFLRDGKLVIHSGMGQALAWEGPAELGSGAGFGGGLEVADYDEDGVLEALIGTDRGVAIYELEGPLAIFTDGFETGGVGRWSFAVSVVFL